MYTIFHLFDILYCLIIFIFGLFISVVLVRFSYSLELRWSFLFQNQFVYILCVCFCFVLLWHLLLPKSGIASETWGSVSATKFKKTVRDRRIVTPTKNTDREIERIGEYNFFGVYVGLVCWHRECSPFFLSQQYFCLFFSVLLILILLFLCPYTQCIHKFIAISVGYNKSYVFLSVFSSSLFVVRICIRSGVCVLLLNKSCNMYYKISNR